MTVHQTRILDTRERVSIVTTTASARQVAAAWVAWPDGNAEPPALASRRSTGGRSRPVRSLASVAEQRGAGHGDGEKHREAYAVPGKQDENHDRGDGRHESPAAQPRGRAHHIGPRRGAVIHEPSGHVSIERGRPVAGERALEQETEAHDDAERHHERSDDSDR